MGAYGVISVFTCFFHMISAMHSSRQRRNMNGANLNKTRSFFIYHTNA